jgi:hypothetical protein
MGGITSLICSVCQSSLQLRVVDIFLRTAGRFCMVSFHVRD